MEREVNINEQDIADIAERVATILGNMFVADKEVLNVSEASTYLGIKKSYVYELIRLHKIPYHRSRGGKLVYFKRDDLDGWALGTRVPSKKEVEEHARKRNSI